MIYKKIKEVLLALVQTVLYIYLTLKMNVADNFKSTPNPLMQAWKTLILLMLTVALTPLVLAVYYSLLTIKLCVKGMLYLWWGDRYAGTFDEVDAVMILKTNSQYIVNTVVVVEYDGDDFFERAKATAKARLSGKDLPRLFSLRESFLGYGYFRKVGFDINDHFQEFDITKNEVATIDEFKVALSKLANNRLPKNDKATWEVLISKQKVRWDNGKLQMIYLLRVHHSVGDGVCIYKILVGMFQDFRSKLDESMGVGGSTSLLTPTDGDGQGESKTFADIKYYVDKFVIFLDLFSKLHLKFQGCKNYNSTNILHGKPISGKKLVAFRTETTPSYVQKVKDIKNRLPNTTFSEVLFTSVSASVAQHFKNKAQDVPEYVQSTFTIHSKSEDLGFYETGNLELVQFGNKFIWAIINLPIIEKTKSQLGVNDYLIDRLESIKTEFNALKQSMDIQFNHFMCKYVIDAMPMSMIRSTLRASNKPTLSVSNLPGNKALWTLGSRVTDIIFYTPHVGTMGVGLTLMTYDNRFQLGIMVDEVFIDSYDDLHKILDDIFYYIDQLHEKTR